MKIIGLTGGYASGKNTVARIFAEKGAVIIDADELARHVVRQGSQAWREVIDFFGKEILLGDGEINRPALAEIIFNDREKRERLNRIIHPRVFEEEEREIARVRSERPDAIVVLNVPLLIESGHQDECDAVVVVNASEETQISRLMARDTCSREEAIKKISAQMPLTEKLLHADYVVDNNGSLEQTRKHVWDILSEITSLPPHS